MTFTVSSNKPAQTSADRLVLFVFQDDAKKNPTYVPTPEFTELNTSLKGALVDAAKAELFKGGAGEIVSLFTHSTIVPTKVLLVGLGKKSDFVLNDLRNTIGKHTKPLKKKVTSIAIVLPSIPGSEDDTMTLHALYEGIALSSYEFGKYKKKKDDEKELEAVTILVNGKADKKKLTESIDHARLFVDATVLARDLVNEQSAVATPSHLANLAKDIAKSSPSVTCKVFDKKEAEKMGMEAFLGIARAAGDDVPPKFIYLSYTPSKKSSKRKLALVGKGITFDSGGINVKPGDHMSDMKMDMAGAAIVLGVFSVIAKIKPDFPVIGLIAATPNLISGTSVVPGDVVRAMNGKTIEILNTDAEGRVTMADSLSFAVKEGATEILDFATLTGAALVALGDDIAAIFSNNKDLLTLVESSAFSAGEKVWELPLEKDYKDLNRSEVADVANIPSTRYAGTITAALFLQEFIDDASWVHFDIAGPAFANKPSPISHKGGTGFGVRTVLNLLEEGKK